MRSWVSAACRLCGSRSGPAAAAACWSGAHCQARALKRVPPVVLTARPTAPPASLPPGGCPARRRRLVQLPPASPAVCFQAGEQHSHHRRRPVCAWQLHVSGAGQEVCWDLAVLSRGAARLPGQRHAPGDVAKVAAACAGAVAKVHSCAAGAPLVGTLVEHSCTSNQTLHLDFLSDSRTHQPIPDCALRSAGTPLWALSLSATRPRSMARAWLQATAPQSPSASLCSPAMERPAAASRHWCAGWGRGRAAGLPASCAAAISVLTHIGS